MKNRSTQQTVNTNISLASPTSTKDVWSQTPQSKRPKPMSSSDASASSTFSSFFDSAAAGAVAPPPPPPRAQQQRSRLPPPLDAEISTRGKKFDTLIFQIGDETFIIAALMAMRHPKSNVLSGALSALVVMMVLSTGLGRIVPNLISRKHTNSAATVLYAFFGLRLLYIAWRSDSKASQKKEMEEVEEKLETQQGKTASISSYIG
ncbi:hypothetical protein IFM89_008169 [Coptis chinensis]|uniref:GDT1 family protein n=1 Tax=Coptis chinensis TaxID=261450 RepID=A0A835IVA7_9MAGN|nr:hypothetical protein IFM89_008169 [Coptis chinensis]